MQKVRKSIKQIPWRNKSPVGWWIASYLERFEYEDETQADQNRRCLAWENTILIKAKNRETAFLKAERVGQQGEGNEGYRITDGRKGKWRYEGLTSLLPIYEELGDGA